jgi:hypothetical protein
MASPRWGTLKGPKTGSVLARIGNFNVQRNVLVLTIEAVSPKVAVSVGDSRG